MAKDPTDKIARQIEKAGLPICGNVSFQPQLTKNKRGEPIMQRAPVEHGPKRGQYGYLDIQGRIWVRDRAHGEYPDHWDVQLDGGKSGYIRVDDLGNILP